MAMVDKIFDPFYFTLPHYSNYYAGAAWNADIAESIQWGKNQ